MNEKNELVERLEKISSLFKTVLSIQGKMNDFVPEDCYERKIAVPVFPGEYKDEREREAWVSRVDHRGDAAIEKMSAQYDAYLCPKKPKKPNVGKRPEPETPLVDEFKKKKQIGVYVAFFFCICASFCFLGELFSGGLFNGNAFGMMIQLALAVGCGIAIYRFYKEKERLEKADAEVTRMAIESYEREKVEKEQKYEEDMKAYQLQMDSFALAKSDFMKAYENWREVYLKSLQEESEIESQLERDRETAVEKIKQEELMPAVKDLLDLNDDLVGNDYLPVLDDIIGLLKNGRADGLKEAINLYEDVVFREKELQLQREKEERRQYEEDRRRADEERRYQEEMRFRKDQERQRQREEENRRADEERRHREDMKQREQMERDRANAERERMRKEDMNRIDQERKQQSAGSAQCQACIHGASCNMRIHNKAPNCAGFRPR